MERRVGIIAEFTPAMIRHNDIRYFGMARDDLVSLTIQHRQLSQMEVLIGGYDEDPRSMYEVPEVRKWIRLVHAKWVDSLFWLTPGSMWVFVLSLNPQMYSRLPDGRLQISFDYKHLDPQFEECLDAGADLLRRGGLGAADVDRAIEYAIATYMQMPERKQLGDYAVVHPDTGEMTKVQMGG